MSNDRYVVKAGSDEGVVQLSEDGAKAGIAFGTDKAQCEGKRAGSTLWAAMKKGGVHPQKQNLFVVQEAAGDGHIIAVIPATMVGAHVSWTVLYRVDKASSAFKSAGARKTIGDALDLAFEHLAQEHFLPHKP